MEISNAPIDIVYAVCTTAPIESVLPLLAVDTNWRCAAKSELDLRYEERLCALLSALNINADQAPRYRLKARLKLARSDMQTFGFCDMSLRKRIFPWYSVIAGPCFAIVLSLMLLRIKCKR